MKIYLNNIIINSDGSINDYKSDIIEAELSDNSKSDYITSKSIKYDNKTYKLEYIIKRSNRSIEIYSSDEHRYKGRLENKIHIIRDTDRNSVVAYKFSNNAHIYYNNEQLIVKINNKEVFRA